MRRQFVEFGLKFCFSLVSFLLLIHSKDLVKLLECRTYFSSCRHSWRSLQNRNSTKMSTFPIQRKYIFHLVLVLVQSRTETFVEAEEFLNYQKQGCFSTTTSTNRCFVQIPKNNSKKIPSNRKVCFTSQDGTRVLSILIFQNILTCTIFPMLSKRKRKKKRRGERVTVRSASVWRTEKRHGRRWKRLNRGFLNEREKEREREREREIGHRSFSLSSSGSNNSKTAVGLSGSRGTAYYSTITFARVGQDVQSGRALHPPLSVGFKCRLHCLLLNYERGWWRLPCVCVNIISKFSGAVWKFIRRWMDRSACGYASLI